MTDRMYFVYEKDFSSRWIPAVYYEKPEKRMEYNIERSPIHEVPEDCIISGEPAFGKLQAKFPPPQEKIDDQAD